MHKRDNPENLDGPNYWSGSYNGRISKAKGEGAENYPQDKSMQEASMTDLKRGYQKGG